MHLGFEFPNVPVPTHETWAQVEALRSTVCKVRPYHLSLSTLEHIRARNLAVILRSNADEGVTFDVRGRTQELRDALEALQPYARVIYCIIDNEPNHINNNAQPTVDYWARVRQVFETLALEFPGVKFISPPMAVAQNEPAWYASGHEVIRLFDFVGVHLYGQTDNNLVTYSLDLARAFDMPIIADELGNTSKHLSTDNKAFAVASYARQAAEAGVHMATIFIAKSPTQEWDYCTLPTDKLGMIANSVATVSPPPPVKESELNIPAVLVAAALALAPGPQQPTSKPLVWDWHEANITAVATYRPTLSAEDVLTIAFGLGAAIFKESGGQYDARGDLRNGYYCSRGLFQLNTCNGAGVALMKKYGIHADDLDDPTYQYEHAKDLILSLEAELYWSRQENRPFNPGAAIQSVQRSSSDPTGAGYTAAYHTLRAEATAPGEVGTMATVRIGNLDVVDLSARYPSTYASRELSAITNISVHHSATPTLPESATEAEEIAALDSIHAYHLKEFRGISYHAAVFPSGRCYHLADWSTIRYLVGGIQNVSTLGLLFHGTFMGVNPGDLQIEAGQSFIANARMQLGNGGVAIEGHQDISPTACPGDGWSVWKHRLTGESAPVPTPVPTPEPTPEPDALEIQLGSIFGQTETILNAVAGIRAAVAAIKDGRG